MSESAVRVSLQQVRIASPCQERWEDMKGDEVRRFCDGCGLFVHNLSAMTEEQAGAFLAEAAESQGARRTCVRLYKRADGTVITRNCPVGLARARERAWVTTRRAIAACVLAGVSLMVWRRADAASRDSWRGATQTRGVAPFSWISQRLGWNPPSAGTSVIMGDIMCPPAPTLQEHVKDLAGIKEGA